MSVELSTNLVSEITARTLMEAAFIMAEPLLEAPPLRGDLLSARISFSASRSGKITIIMGRQLATTLAANLLGLEPDDEEASSRGGDALGELLNMVGGALLGELAPAGGAGTLGLPEVSPVRGPRAEPLAVSSAALLTDEGESIEVVLELEPAS